MNRPMNQAIVTHTGTVHTFCCSAATKALCRPGYSKPQEITQERAAEMVAQGEGHLCKACAKMALNSAPAAPQTITGADGRVRDAKSGRYVKKS